MQALDTYQDFCIFTLGLLAIVHAVTNGALFRALSVDGEGLPEFHYSLFLKLDLAIGCSSLGLWVVFNTYFFSSFLLSAQ